MLARNANESACAAGPLPRWGRFRAVPSTCGAAMGRRPPRPWSTIRAGTPTMTATNRAMDLVSSLPNPAVTAALAPPSATGSSRPRMSTVARPTLDSSDFSMRPKV